MKMICLWRGANRHREGNFDFIKRKGEREIYREKMANLTGDDDEIELIADDIKRAEVASVISFTNFINHHTNVNEINLVKADTHAYSAAPA